MRLKPQLLWRNFVFTRQGICFKTLYNLSYGYGNNSLIRIDQNKLIVFGKIAGNYRKIYLARPHSAYRFRSGLQKRFCRLYREYFLDMIPVNDDDVVVDVGANIGEIGIFYQIQNRKIQYICVEPEDKELEACMLNNPGSIPVKGILWNENTKVEFHHAPESEDSSAIRSEMHHSKTLRSAFTLESVLKKKSIKFVKLLKLEAEGAEPEVLEGAKTMLPNIEYISADLGPERGFAKECTIEAVTNFLLKHDFEIKKVHYPGRLNCLYKNKNIKT